MEENCKKTCGVCSRSTDDLGVLCGSPKKEGTMHRSGTRYQANRGFPFQGAKIITTTAEVGRSSVNANVISGG